MANEIDEIKSRLDIVDVIGEYVKLKPAGQNWKGLCPFHGEKTPSFMVHRERQFWHCFGCNIGGDVLEFVKRIENMDFAETLELLAKKAGVTLARDQYNPGEVTRRQKILQAIELASEYYQAQFASPQAAIAKHYADARGLTPELVREFEVGYAPAEWGALGLHLRQHGVGSDIALAAGLVLRSERGPGYYDRFRNRLVFPIADAQGRTVGFGGRTLSSDAREAKYINSPQNDVYNKSLVVYNLHRAKEHIKQSGFAVLVEGYMDVAASWRAGVKNVVAVSGTALTPEQLKLLGRYTNELRLAFDADLAGRSASERGIDLALAQEFEVKVITLPFGKDPDECVARDPAAFSQAVAQALPIVDHAFQSVLKEVDIATREGKKSSSAKLLSAIAKLPNAVERDYYLKRLAAVLQVSESALRESLPRRSAETISVAPPSANFGAPKPDRETIVAQHMLALVLKFPKLISRLAERLAEQDLAHPPARGLYKYLIAQYNEKHQVDLSELELVLAGDAELKGLLPTLALIADHEFPDLTEVQAQYELLRLADELKKHAIGRALKQVSEAITRASQAGQPVEDLLIEHRELTAKRSALDS